MEKKEKLENTKQNITVQFSEDERHMLIFDESTDSLLCRTSFYSDFIFGMESLKFSKKEKQDIGRKMIEGIFAVLESRGKDTWEFKCEMFKEAYKHELKNKVQVSWLMTTVLGLSQEEAERRFDTASELLSHPDFKSKEDIIVDKIYLKNPSV